MKHIRIIICALAAVLAFGSCKSSYDALLSGNDNELKYKTAFELYEQGKYIKAAKLFESVAVITNGTERDDTVQFYWGLSNYRYGDYESAQVNFESFLEKFPRSSFAEDASFFRTDCLYNQTLRYELDQTPTYKALTAIAEFLIAYPQSERREVCAMMSQDLNERLDRKAYENAKLYYKMEDYKASRVAFKNILKDDFDNVYREEILYYAAMSSYKYASLSVDMRKKERFLIFFDDYLNYIGEYPDTPHAKELTNIYKRVKKNETSIK